MAVLNAMKRASVCFVCPTRRWGTHLLRGVQVQKALKRHGVPARTINTAGLCRVRNSIVVFVKVLTRELCSIARTGNNLVVYDIMDGYERDLAFLCEQGLCDAIIAPNDAMAAYLRPRLHPSIRYRTIYHHIDPRLLRLINPAKQASHFCLGYIGNLPENTGNAVHVKSIPELHVVETDTRKARHTGWMRHASRFTCHYNVRPEGMQVTGKPLAKIAVAAACNANIILNSTSPGRELLGSDYPYYTQSDEESVVRAVAFARDSFGSETWMHGLEIMSTLKQRLHIGNVVKDYIALFEHLQQAAGERRGQHLSG